MKGFSHPSGFFCKFKTHDNIQFNLEILRNLYWISSKLKDRKKKLLFKPVFLITTSIIEAILHDFYLRIYSNVYEGVKNLENHILEEIRSKKIDEFAKYISVAKKYDFFELKETNFYEALEHLRKIRNRIHIQNSKQYKPKNENIIYDDQLIVLSEKCLEKIIKVMYQKYNRTESLHRYQKELSLPWLPHI
ncbi:MAG TPA: hypothetical protein PKA60_00610 [Candidatus Paceibacterota bacterium]|nr:hypothetical protein [Candidatus Paceibacterota bacterium]